LAASLTAALFTAITFAALSWGVAESAARGVDGNKLPALLTLGNFSVIDWPYRVGGVSVKTHVLFYAAIVVLAVIAGLATLIATRTASPRSGASAFVGTWIGVVLGAALVGVALYFATVGDAVSSAAGRNDYLVDTVKGMAFGGLIVGWFPALFAWSAFKVANRKGLVALEEAEAASSTDESDNPFDFTPGSIAEPRAVEPGFTYPSGDEFADAFDTQNAYSTTPDRSSMVDQFSDTTDVTGEDDVTKTEDNSTQLREPGAA